MELYHYPYHYVQRFDEVPATQASFLRYRLLYTFKSPKSHQWYWVWVERYDYNLYAVKFHLKAHRDRITLFYQAFSGVQPFDGHLFYRGNFPALYDPVQKRLPAHQKIRTGKESRFTPYFD